MRTYPLLLALLGLCCGNRTAEREFLDSRMELTTAYAPPPGMVNNTVWYHLGLYQIVDVDEKMGILDLKLYIYIFYEVHGLAWNASENANEQLMVPAGTFWTPDIIPMEMTELRFQMFDRQVLHSAGFVVAWSSIVYAKVACSLDVTYFPYDRQTCSLTATQFGSNAHTYEIKAVEAVDGMPQSFFKANDQWDILETSFRKTAIEAAYKEVEVHAIEYSIVFKRNPGFFKKIIIAPAVVLLFVSSATFVLPVECGEKVSLSVTLLLSQTVNLLTLQDLLPSSAKYFPVLGDFVLFSIVVTAFSVGYTVLVIDVHFVGSTDRRVPAFMVNFMSCPCRMGLLCLKPLHLTELEQPKHQQHNNNKEENTAPSDITMKELKPSEMSEYGRNAEGLLERHLAETREQHVRKLVWEKLAATLDRLMFIAYTNTVLVGTGYYMGSIIM